MTQLSIIVPVLNEGAQILPFLRHLRDRAPSTEIIVVDGGSTDTTVQFATNHCDQLLCTRKARAIQMNEGALAASGRVLWFLHADCEIPNNAPEAIFHAIHTQRHVGGCFRVRIPDRRPVFRIHDSWAHYIGKAVRVRCGDHGIFSTREAFHDVGGYPDVPLMEDVDFVRALHSVGTFAWLDQRLTLSSRRHYQIGPYRYTFICAAIVALYCLGFDNATLSQLYSRMIPHRHSGRATRPLPPVEPALFSEYREPKEKPNTRPEGDCQG